MSVPQHGQPNQALIRLEHIGKTYRMGEVSVEVLRDVSLEVLAGETLVVVGPSGSGKTTLLNLVGGMDSPSQGKVWFQGQDLTGFSPRQRTDYRRRCVGFVFQFYNLIPSLTARENILVASEISEAPLDAEEVLRMVELQARRDHFPAQLSGGEQQRVAIARALVKNPPLLLCDEPTGALDYQTGKTILRLLADVQRRLGKTVMLITHNRAIGHLADRVVHLRSGEVVEVEVNRAPMAPEALTW